MSAMTSSKESIVGQLLPQEVRNLIVRKLQLRRLDQEHQYAAAMQLAYLKLKKEVEAVIGTSKIARAFTSIPLAVFEEIIAEAVAMTRSWPGVVWDTITSVLNKLQLGSYDSNELHAIMDEFAWCKEQKPFTYPYIAADGFRERFYRLLSSYGLQRADLIESFNFQLELAAAAAEAGILNTARWAREEIGIDIDEYLIEERFRKGNEADIEMRDNNSPARSSSPAETTCKQCEVFLKMKNLTSDELRILFVGDKAKVGLAPKNMLEISARNVSRRFTPGELDLVDGRTGSLNSQGVLLLGMAGKLSVLYSTINAKKISRLRAFMRQTFGVRDDLFDRHKSEWSPRFQISDARGLADERAKKAGERRTVSLDQQDDFADRQTAISDSEYTFDRENDENDEWIENHS